jgi:hypothetical protein
MRRSGTVGLAVLLVVTSIASGLVVAGAAEPAGSTAGPAGPSVSQIGNQSIDSTEFRITVYENSSARWSFVYKTTLKNESERQEFQEYADRFNSQETDLYTNFKDRARSVTDEGTQATGREMNATGFSKAARIASLTENQGVVRMSFIWTNFAVQDGTAVVMGDVFQGGFYIGPDQRLVVQRGPDLRFQDVGSDPVRDGDSLAASDTLTWLGEREFIDGHPRVVLVPPSEPTPTPTAESPVTSEPGPGDGGSSTGFLPLLGLGVVLLLGLGAALAYRTGALPGGDGDGGAAANSTADGGAGGGAAAGGAAASGGSPEPAVPDEELLEDDERVMQLLEENGGRMKQVNIVDETGWSKSKVSMLLSDMEDEEQISKLRVGRENIISKKGMEPDAAGSPFDDEH